MVEEREELFYLCAQTIQHRSRVIVTRANAVSSDVKYKYCVDHRPHLLYTATPASPFKHATSLVINHLVVPCLNKEFCFELVVVRWCMAQHTHFLRKNCEYPTCFVIKNQTTRWCSFDCSRTGETCNVVQY